MGTHLSQHRPDEVEAEAKVYMRLIRPFLIGPHCDLRFIINMDQTPVYFAMSAKRTLEAVGKKQSTSALQQTTTSGRLWR
jgi:hypothetical protein